jgi:signal transduction histidine kinase
MLICLQFMEYQHRQRAIRAAMTIAGGRLAYLLAAPRGALFSPELFASEFSLVGSTGDLLLTSISILFLSFLIPLGGEIRGRRSLWAATAQVGCAALLGLGSSLIVGYAISRSTIPSLPLGRLSLSPTIVAFVASFAVLFGALARCLAAVPRPSARLSIAGGMLLGVLGIAGGEVFTVSGALLISATVLVAGTMWSVGRIALLAVLTAGVFLIAVVGRQLTVLRKAHAEALAGELSRSHEPWFTLLVEEALLHGTQAQRQLQETWHTGPLGVLPVTGELALLDGQGSVVDRFSFGVRRQSYEGLPDLDDMQSSYLWSDVFEHGASPMVMIRGIKPVTADTFGGNGYLMLSVVADIVSPLLLHGVPRLADGTSWPLMIRFVDHGLISEIEPGGLAPGWRLDNMLNVDALTFQREFADGPHFVSLLVLSDPLPERIAAGLVIFGVLCLAAQVVFGLRNLWLAPSLGRLFYRYRDRLLPLLLALGAGPVAVLLLLGPVLEKEVQQKQRTQQAQERAKEVATNLREEMLAQATLYAGYADSAMQPSSERDVREKVWVFDDAGRALQTDEIPVRQISSGLIRAAIEWSRSMFVIGSDGKSALSVVPHRLGALTLQRPLDRLLEDAQGEYERWSVGAWHRGVLVAASVVPPCSPVPRFLPSRVMSLGSGASHSQTTPGGWTFQALSDDVLEVALTVGVRREGHTDAITAWESTELWVLAVFLPLLAVTVLVSSAAARLVSRPVSQLTALALHVQYAQQYEPWPRLSGELGELGNALEQMTGSLIKSRRDIEERKAYLEVVLSQVTSCVIVVDREGAVSLYNAAAKQLLSSLTRPTGEESVSVTAGPLERVVNAVLSTGRSAHDSLRIDLSSGERLWRIAAAPLARGRGEEPFAAVVVLEEMTEFAEEQRLVAWTEFAREVAHEIKNPLTPIKLAVQHLRRAYEERGSEYGSVLNRATTMIERQAAKMEEIVKEFSSFARATGREFTTVLVGELLEECISDYRYVETKGIDITFEQREGEILVRGDREALRRVFANLLDNAIRALDSTGGVIQVKVAKRGEAAEIVFEDNGPGVRPETVSRLFEPGFSLRPGGTGMGLAICKSLVNAHGGTIELVNRSEEGIRVIVTFPLAAGSHE